MKTRSESGASHGHWEQAGTEWYEQKMSYCECCGMLLPGRQFVVEMNGVSRRFCRPQCASLAEVLRKVSRSADTKGNKG